MSSKARKRKRKLTHAHTHHQLIIDDRTKMSFNELYQTEQRVNGSGMELRESERASVCSRSRPGEKKKQRQNIRFIMPKLCEHTYTTLVQRKKTNPRLLIISCYTCVFFKTRKQKVFTFHFHNLTVFLPFKQRTN